MTRALLFSFASSLLLGTALAAPAASASSSASVSAAARVSPSGTQAIPPPDSTAPIASDDPNNVIFQPDSNVIPEPVRGQLGVKEIGPQNVPVELQNPDLLAPPTTDHGELCVPL